MSGIVGSYFNTRGSGVVAKLGTDGQLFTSSGAGVSQAFEAAAGGGKLLQVVQTVKTDTFIASATSFTDVTGLSVAITPSSVSSKILLSANINIYHQASSGFLKLQRDIGGGGYADSAYIADEASARIQCIHFLIGDYQQIDANMNYLDSPNTTSAVTYQVQGYTYNATYPLYVNRFQADTDGYEYGRSASSITAIEIGA